MVLHLHYIILAKISSGEAERALQNLVVVVIVAAVVAALLLLLLSLLSLLS